MVDHSTTVVKPNHQGRSAEVKRRVILLAVPSQDRLTEYCSALLENFPNLGAPTLLCPFKSVVTYDELLSQKSIDPLEADVALIYCGHGYKDSLLGPRVQGEAPDNVNAAFFNQSHVAIGPKFLLAFCSNAAAVLGKSYERMTTDRTFIGFEGEIGFVLAGGVYAQWWKRILYGMTSAMLNSTNVEQLEKSVLDLYKEAISFFSTENGKNHKWALMMRVYLRKQMEAIRFIKT